MKMTIKIFPGAHPVRSKSSQTIAVLPKAERTSNGMWIIPLHALMVWGMVYAAPVFAAPADCNDPLKFCNPITADSFPALITAIAEAVRQIGTVLAVAAIIFVGLRFVIAAASGDTGALTKARQMLWYVLIGTVIVVGASYLAEVAVSIVKNLPK